MLASVRRGRGAACGVGSWLHPVQASWSSIAHQLGSSYEVVAIDLPDHAGSTDVHADSLEDAASLLGATGGEAAYVGYSLGGRVCLTLALQSPELVTSLALVGATPGIADEDARRDRRRSDNALADRLDPNLPGQVGLEARGLPRRVALRPAVRAPRPRATGPTLQARELPRRSRPRAEDDGDGMPGAELRTARGVVDAGPPSRRGGRSALLGDRQGDGRIDRPQRERGLPRGAGHAAPFEAPARFADVLRGFLATT